MSFLWIFECEDDGYDGDWLDPDEKVALSKEDETLSWDEEDELDAIGK